MNIIAFDLGRNFAWARNTDPLRVGNFTMDGPRAHRQGRLLEYLDALFERAVALQAVVYETPFARGRDATRSLWGIAGIIEACATNAGLPVVDVAVPTIKKFATGNGFAPKTEMIIAAKKFGYKGNSEHEADAVCLLKYAEANLEKVI
jgi:Holliday junction resolvasome RuvABC endonuclease subunit